MSRVRLVELALLVVVIGMNNTTAYALGEADGISTYNNTQYSSCTSVFANGAKVYVQVMDWVQKQGGRSAATVTSGAESISVKVYDDGTSPDTAPNDGHYWGVFTVGTGKTNDAADYLHLDDGKETTITADLGNDGTSGTFRILAHYNTNPKKIIVPPGKSIQEAINNLPPDGGIVELAPGEHIVNTGKTIIVNKSNVTIQGPRSAIVKHNTINTGPGKAEACFRIPRNNHRNIVFKGFSTTSTYTYGRSVIFSASGVTHYTVEDIYDTSYAGSLAGVGHSSNVFFKNLTTTTGRPDLGAAYAKHTFFVNNNINGIMGIDMNRSNRFIYLYNNRLTSRKWNIRIHGGQTNYEILGNLLYGGQAGICFDDGSSNGIVRHNIIREARTFAGCNPPSPPFPLSFLSLLHPDYTFAGVFICPQGQHRNVVLRNNVICNNIAHGVLTGHYSHGFSGKITTVVLANNVIHNNTGNGICMRSPYVNLILKNNIITENGRYGINRRVAAVLTHDGLHSHNDVWNNKMGNYKNISAGHGDISQDPLFAAPAEGNFHLKSKAGRWDAKAKKWIKDEGHSPCIDAGGPKADWSKEPAPNGGRVNIGAYGNTEKASKSVKK